VTSLSSVSWQCHVTCHVTHQSADSVPVISLYTEFEMACFNLSTGRRNIIYRMC